MKDGTYKSYSESNIWWVVNKTSSEENVYYVQK
jgi:hypothetical protein